MKNAITLCCLLYTITLAGQSETLLSSENARFGGFGGPIVELSSINGDPVVDVGGGGGLTINGFFVGGYGMGTDAGNVIINDRSHDVSFSHGGLWLGYAYRAHKLIHPYASLRMGGGEMEALASDGDGGFSDGFFVTSPDLGIELNVASWFKIVASAGYRFTTIDDTAIPMITADEVDSFTGSLTFRFGFFNDY